MVKQNRKENNTNDHFGQRIIFNSSNLLLRFLSPERRLRLSRSLSRSRSLGSLSRDLLRRRLDADGEGDLLCTIIILRTYLKRKFNGLKLCIG